MRNKQSLAWWMVAVGAFVPTALACVNLVVPPMGNIEEPPCTGNCNSYAVCPPDETCPGGYIDGFNRCTSTTLTVGCTQYSGGTTRDGACCEGGSPVLGGSTSVTRVKVFLTPVNYCWFYEPVPGEE